MNILKLIFNLTTLPIRWVLLVLIFCIGGMIFFIILGSGCSEKADSWIDFLFENVFPAFLIGFKMDC